MDLCEFSNGIKGYLVGVGAVVVALEAMEVGRTLLIRA